MSIVRYFLVALVLVLSGCATTNQMVKASNQQLTNAAADQSQVVFMRSSFVGHLISASVYDVTDGEPEFVGIIENDTKVLTAVKPGKRIFMVVSEAADFMEADLTAGKTYYAVITPRMGMWKARFSLWPVRVGAPGEFTLNDKRIQSMITDTELMEGSEKAQLWFKGNLQSIKAKQQEYWPSWQQKNGGDKLERTLLRSDGV